MNQLFLLIAIAISFTFATTQNSRAEAQKFKLKDATYVTQEIHGWKVHVDERILASEDWDTCKNIISGQLFHIIRFLPKTIVADMKKVPVYFDAKLPVRSSACYHPSKSWLVKNGYPAEKAKSVEINGLKKFINSTRTQPAVMLHELVHAYHDIVLGFDNAKIKEAYDKNMKAGKYQSVLRIHSTKKVKHYAATDHKEYLAEAVEAFYSTNDYYPFVRSELKIHDPDIYKVITELFESKRKK